MWRTRATRPGFSHCVPGLTLTPFSGFALALTRAHSRSRIFSLSVMKAPPT